jgi:hypothetical protein
MNHTIEVEITKSTNTNDCKVFPLAFTIDGYLKGGRGYPALTALGSTEELMSEYIGDEMGVFGEYPVYAYCEGQTVSDSYDVTDYDDNIIRTITYKLLLDGIPATFAEIEEVCFSMTE